jgi:hypothetical protein
MRELQGIAGHAYRLVNSGRWGFKFPQSAGLFRWRVSSTPKSRLARCDAEGFRVVRLRDPSNAANTILLDHLISLGEERRWYFKSERVVYLSLGQAITAKAELGQSRE